MRLGVRRKLIGTLMMVGLIPMGVSLIIILGGFTALRLNALKAEYNSVASDISHQLVGNIHSELEKLHLISTIPSVINYTREQNALRAARSSATTMPDRYIQEIEGRWTELGESQEPLRALRNNPIADRFRNLLSQDPAPRHFRAAGLYGDLIACDQKPERLYQAQTLWWRGVLGTSPARPFVGTVIVDPLDGQSWIHLAVPIFDDHAGGKRPIGVVMEAFRVDLLEEIVAREVAGLGARGYLLDIDMDRVVVGVGGDADPEILLRRYHQSLQPSSMILSPRRWVGNSTLGSQRMAFQAYIPGFLNQARFPNWVIVVAKPSSEAMVPIYHLAVIVAIIGIVLILLIFIVGVVVSDREIIVPILRLREATAAVGRGELHVRLVPAEWSGESFRADEIGQLARDFDEMTRQLQKNVGQLARSNEAKRRFMELAGHELRTPVTYILGVCQLTQRQIQTALATIDSSPGHPLVQNLAAALGKIAAKTQRLSRIIDNLLKLVTHDQYTARMLRVPVDLKALILQVCNDHRPFITERQQNLEIDLPDQLPIFEGDRDKLEDVLSNLISNAIRFSPDQSLVKVSARHLAEDMLEITIEDSGSGIPEEDLANLFEPFYTGSDIMHHHSGTIEYGSKGLGLGLAIVRRFVELHGGVVRAQSTGHGTQFQVLLPLHRICDTEAAPRPIEA